jgi:hypothetical protein
LKSLQYLFAILESVTNNLIPSVDTSSMFLNKGHVALVYNCLFCQVA